MNRPRLRWMLDRGQALRELVGRHSRFAWNYGDTISISRRRKRVDQSPDARRRDRSLAEGYFEYFVPVRNIPQWE
jgi:hypothetical protein